MRRIWCCAIFLVVAASAVPRAFVAASAAPPPVAAPAPTPDEASAVASARRTGRPVEIPSRGSETTRVFANPSGTFTMEEHSEPFRVLRGAGWVPVETTLRSGPGGTVSPGATVTDLSLSNGGSGPLARIGRAGHELSLGWPSPLPAPSLSGDTATYAGVLPGVDLQVRATADGLAELLIVRTRQAAGNPALARVRFTTATKGLTLSGSADGGLAAKDAAGATVFSAAAPAMWDATGPNDIQPRQAPVRLQVGAGELTLRPDARMLADPTMRYPLTIDPFVSFGLRQWGNVTAAAPNQGISSDPFRSEGGKAGMGCDAYGCYVYRSLWAFTGLPYGTHVLNAVFGATLYHSWSCSDTPVELWLTGGINNASNWYSPQWYQWLDTKSAHAYSGCGGPVRMLFGNGLAGAVQQGVNAGWPDITVGLKAPNEGDVYQWKRFQTDVSLSVEYNSFPNQPSGLSTQGKGCTVGAGRPWLGTTMPQVSAMVSDPDHDNLNVAFQFWTTGGTFITTIWQNNVGSGAPAIVNVPANVLADGGSYSWRVGVNDGIDGSPWSGSCEFSIDATPANPASGVTSTDYPNDGSVHGQVGQSGHFALSPPTTAPDHVTGYLVGLNQCNQTSCARAVSANPTDHSGAVDVAPNLDGRNVLNVWTVNRAGLSDSPHPFVYSFLVRAGQGPAAYWPANEGTGTTTADAASHGNTATLAGGATWTAGRSNVGSALSMNGSTAYAATAGVVQARDPNTGNLVPLHTNQSYSVAAWVKPSTVNGTASPPVMVSSNGVHSTPFMLRYQFGGVNARWRFDAVQTDVDNPSWATITGTSQVLTDRWTFVAGTYDSGSQTIKLYVNGIQEGPSVTIAGTFDSGGPVVIGAARWNDQLGSFFPGAIKDVRVWNRVVQPTELAALARPLPPAITAPTLGRVNQPIQVTLSAGGDANVTSYKYSLDDPSLATPSTATPSTPGAPVTVTVTATTVDIHTVFAKAVDVRSGLSDLAAQDIEVDDLPSAPTGVAATPGAGQATVSWTPPATDGGTSVTAYTVTASPGGLTASVDGASTSATVTGLTNGTSYTFTVTATNGVGTGPASAASAAVTPLAAPGAPILVTAVAGTLQATVSWSAPGSNGGTAITAYTVTASPGGQTASVNGTTTTATVTGLTGGTTYTFTVTATNAVGTGAASAASNSVIPTSPAVAPDPPTGVTAFAANQQANVSWTPPAKNGGSPITGYTVTVTPGGQTVGVGGGVTNATITGLTNGTTYTFTVTATNAVGTSPASVASNSVVPSSPAGAPTGVTAVAGNGQATVSWTAPASNGGSAITTYTVIASPGGQAVTAGASATSALVAGLTNGTSYMFTVTANNSAGAGTPSAASAAVTPSIAAGHLGASFVQQANGHGSNLSNSSLAVTFASGVTAGDRIVVVVGGSWYPSGAPPSVTDSAGNTYTSVASGGTQDGTEASVWTAVVTAGGGTALTVTAVQAQSSGMAMAAIEYAGLSTAGDASAVDTSAGNNGLVQLPPDKAFSASTAATTAANELAIGVWVSGGAASNAPATFDDGWTTRSYVEPNPDMGVAIEDETVPLAATPAATLTQGDAGFWMMDTIVFKLATP